MRLQSILDSIAIIHPGTIKQLRMMSEKKKFADRKLEDHARSRASFASSKEDEAARAEEQQKDRTDPIVGHDPVPEVPAVTMGNTAGHINLEEAKMPAPSTAPLSAASAAAPAPAMTMKTTVTATVDPSATAGTPVTPAAAAASAALAAAADPGAPPSDAPVDAVWVLPADANLVLRARHLHEVLETEESLQDGQIERRQRAKLRQLRKQRRAARRAEQAAKKDPSESSVTTSHAMAFAKRIGDVGGDVRAGKKKIRRGPSPAQLAAGAEDDQRPEADGGLGAGSNTSELAEEIAAREDPTGLFQRGYDDSVEQLRLRSLLAFLLYADATKLDRTKEMPLGGNAGDQEPETEEDANRREDEEERAAMRRRNLRRLGRSGNWSSFVEDLTARFPLRHPVNLDAQDRLMQRIGDAKARRLRHETSERPPFNILATQEKGSVMPNFIGAAVQRK